MADSIRKQLRDHAGGLLSGAVVPAGLVVGATKPVGLGVHAFRTRPLEKDSLPASVVYSGDENIARSSHDLDVVREYMLAVEHRVKGGDIEALLDPLLTWAIQVLLADRQFGGLIVDIEETKIEWAAEERDAVYGGAAHLFKVTYMTAINNPEATP